ncbi:MAG: Hpt domain-containing protein [Desulfovibrionaceae bacterium]
MSATIHRPEGSLHLDRFTAQEHLGIDETTYAAILASAMREAARRFIMARDALEQGQMGELSRHAHTMKSTAKSIGAFPCSELARELELSARNNDAARAAELLQNLHQEYLEVRDEAEAAGFRLDLNI